MSSIIWISVIFAFASPSLVEGKIGEACYGTDLSCDYFSLTCAQNEIIRLGTLRYGLKEQPICKDIENHCQSKDICCRANTSDCSEDFDLRHTYEAYTNCSGRVSCSDVQSPWKLMNCNGQYNTSTYVSLQYECEEASRKLKFCRDANETGSKIEAMFDGSQESFDPTKASRECGCIVMNKLDTQQEVRLNVIDLRLQSYVRNENNTAKCSSAHFWMQGHIDKSCTDSLHHERDNFLKDQEYTVTLQAGHSTELLLEDLYVKGYDDSPAMVWIAIEAEASKSIDIHCREIIPLTTTTTTTSTTMTTTPTTTTTSTMTTTSPATTTITRMPNTTKLTPRTVTTTTVATTPATRITVPKSTATTPMTTPTTKTTTTITSTTTTPTTMTTATPTETITSPTTTVTLPVITADTTNTSIALMTTKTTAPMTTTALMTTKTTAPTTTTSTTKTTSPTTTMDSSITQTVLISNTTVQMTASTIPTTTTTLSAATTSDNLLMSTMTRSTAAVTQRPTTATHVTMTVTTPTTSKSSKTAAPVIAGGDSKDELKIKLFLAIFVPLAVLGLVIAVFITWLYLKYISPRKKLNVGPKRFFLRENGLMEKYIRNRKSAELKPTDSIVLDDKIFRGVNTVTAENLYSDFHPFHVYDTTRMNGFPKTFIPPVSEDDTHEPARIKIGFLGNDIPPSSYSFGDSASNSETKQPETEANVTQDEDSPNVTRNNHLGNSHNHQGNSHNHQGNNHFEDNQTPKPPSEKGIVIHVDNTQGVMSVRSTSDGENLWPVNPAAVIVPEIVENRNSGTAHVIPGDTPKDYSALYIK